jgi:hypothetical protein
VGRRVALGAILHQAVTFAGSGIARTATEIESRINVAHART